MINVRYATNKDVEMIYKWRNEYNIRRFFFDSSCISYEEHKNWYLKSLVNKKRVIFIICHDGKGVGVVRFDKVDILLDWEVDVYIDPSKHGKGFGSKGLYAAIEYFRKNVQDNVRFIAKVLPKNNASKRMFESLGFCTSHILYIKE